MQARYDSDVQLPDAFLNFLDRKRRSQFLPLAQRTGDALNEQGSSARTNDGYLCQLVEIAAKYL